LWLVGAPVLAAVGLVLAGLLLAALSGDQRIGFTVRLSNWSLAWFYVPPLALVAAWLWARRGNRQQPPPAN
jgi:membrane protein implicated in regulation of membrane protease activity